jgi:hypothetical protein
MGRRGGLG